MGWVVVQSRMGAVVAWRSSPVGIAMRIIHERLGLVGAIATWIGNLAWPLAMFFVVPVLLSVPGAIRRSARVFKER